MKKILSLILHGAFETKSRAIDTISLVSTELPNTKFSFNNTKLMAITNIDRYLVSNADTIFLMFIISGIWTRSAHW